MNKIIPLLSFLICLSVASYADTDIGTIAAISAINTVTALGSYSTLKKMGANPQIVATNVGPMVTTQNNHQRSEKSDYQVAAEQEQQAQHQKEAFMQN